jgi:hypothetical protein
MLQHVVPAKALGHAHICRCLLNDKTNTAVILRCSPFFTASLERMGHKRLRPSFETPRKSAAPQDDG